MHFVNQHEEARANQSPEGKGLAHLFIHVLQWGFADDANHRLIVL